jgi:hypothetical protein
MAANDWIDVVNAAGIRAGRLDMGTVFILSGKLIHDSVVVQRKRKYAVNGKIPMGASAMVIRAMSESDREELRSRVQV